MISFSDIPEEDRVCANCERLSNWYEGVYGYKCNGKYPCLNYHDYNTKNYFVPDDDYLSSKFGCKACQHYNIADNPEECLMCSRGYEDKWECQEVIE